MQGKESGLNFSVTIGDVLFHIYDAGSVKNVSSAFSQPYHRHYTWEFHYLYEGEEELYFGEAGERAQIKGKQLCLIGRDLYHAARSARMDRCCFDLTVAPAAKSKNAADHERFCHAFDSAGGHRLFADPYISALMEQYRAVSEPAFRYCGMHRGMILALVALRVFDILSAECDEGAVQLGKVNPNRAADRKWVIENHLTVDYDKPNGLTILARRLYLSERQAGALVKKLMGENYKKLVTRHRMELARRLMEEKKLPLCEIAARVGYSSYNGFFKAYCTYYGELPRDNAKQGKD